MASIALAAGLGAAGSIGGGLIGANAADNAASTQASAAEQAAQLQAELGQEQLGFTNYTYQQGQANQQPWLQSGANSLASLDYLMGIGPGGGNAPQPSVPSFGGIPMNAPSQGGVSTPSASVPMAGPNMNALPGALNPNGVSGGVPTPAPSVPMSGPDMNGLSAGVPKLNPSVPMDGANSFANGPQGTATINGLPSGSVAGWNQSAPTLSGSPMAPKATAMNAAPSALSSISGQMGAFRNGANQLIGNNSEPSSQGGTTLSIPGVGGSINLPGINHLTGTANTNLGTYGSLMSGFPGGNFQAPTLQQAENTPGYQFALQQGQKALQASAAANGSLLTGGTLNALDSYSQGLADTNYNNIYNQALQGYQTNYNTWANQQANEYNRLAAMSGTGQTAAQQLGALGSTTAGQIGNTLSNTAGQIGQQMNNAGAAIASGYTGAANAYGGALSGAGSSLSNGLILSSLMSQGGGVPTIDPNSAMGNALLSPQG